MSKEIMVQPTRDEFEQALIVRDREIAVLRAEIVRLKEYEYMYKGLEK